MQSELRLISYTCRRQTDKIELFQIYDAKIWIICIMYKKYHRK